MAEGSSRTKCLFGDDMKTSSSADIVDLYLSQKIGKSFSVVPVRMVQDSFVEYLQDLPHFRTGGKARFSHDGKAVHGKIPSSDNGF